jgi:NAD(P)-dependent dehydrogenase (short-subunit alcohol dehydrogenase family)
MGWKGRTALITGGVSGIGFGIARAFCATGIDLVLTWRNEDYRAQAQAWFEANGRPMPRFAQLDVTDRAAWAEVAREVGPVHILVNNAGVSVFGPTDDASYADYDWIMGVNFGGVVNGLVTFVPRIKALGEGGHVVNVASMAAYLSGPQAGIYTASKFAVRGLTECLRYNLAPYGIGVSLVCPGLTRTNAWDSALKRPPAYAASGFVPPDRAELERFGTAFEAGMDPLEVGEKTLAGMKENLAVIFTHPEYA